MTAFSDYIIYVDESGSPVLDADLKDFPVFVLACVCVRKDIYTNEIVPALQSFKFKYFGHDQVILHEREIRRQSHEFAFLRKDRNLRDVFLNEFSELINGFDFSIAACVVDKKKLVAQHSSPPSPYSIGLQLTMEQLALSLWYDDQCGKAVHVIAESRGAKEDAELELDFRRIADGDIRLRSERAELLRKFDWHVIFADKKSNSAGLQLADLIARPIGIKALRPQQPNRTYEIIEEKVTWWTKTYP